MTRASDRSSNIGMVAQLLQFFPLSCFLFAAFRHGNPQPEDWLIAFMVGGAVAVLQVILATMISRGRPLNRLLLGVNAYLAIGGLSALTNQLWILQMLDTLRESGLFLCILAVGVLTTLGSKAGFVGQEDGRGESRTKHYSFALLALAIIATTPSFFIKGQLIFSAVIPMTLLTIVNRWFVSRIQRS
ncbi:MAG: hypothetical protein HOP03_17070 [Lysobacter sp.]|nr:hypothetical protein [Lysobacter sp.]